MATRVVLVFLALCLTACGGGGSASPPPGGDTLPGGDVPAELPGTGDTLPGGDVPAELPGTGDTLPGGDVPAELPGPADTAPGGDVPAELPGPADTAPGGDAPADLPGPADTGPGDTAPDAPPDAAPDVPAPAPPTVTLTLVPEWQRGPVTLRFELATAEGGPADVTIAFSADGETWAPATPLAGYSPEGPGLAPGAHRFVWDSFADLDTDEPAVRVRVTASDAHGVGVPALSPAFPVLDAGERLRSVLMTSSINGNNKVRRLTWRFGLGLDYADEVYEVGARPERVAFGPGGKTAVSLDQDAEQLTVFSFYADGRVAATETLPTPERYFTDLVFSGDGATLYLVDMNPTPEAGVYGLALDPWTGRPAPDAAPQQIANAWVASELALLPENRGVALLGGTPPESTGGDLVVRTLAPDGTVTGEVDFAPDGSIPAALTLSPDGQWLFAAYLNLFGAGDGGVLFAVLPDGSLEAADDVALDDPDDAAFHTTGAALLVSLASANRSRGYTLDPLAGTLTAGAELRVDLAGQIARPAVGRDRDVFFVTTVSASTGESGLAVLRLTPDALLTSDGTFSLGDGFDVIPEGVAIQP